MPAGCESALAEQGWAVIDLPDPRPVMDLRALMLTTLRRGLPSLTAIEEYHRHVADDALHLELLWAAAEAYWQSGLGQAIVTANLELFRALLGPDLHIQRRPYLRCVRAGIPADAAPLHRDTHYGASPLEMSILVPLTDMGDGAAIRAIPASHVESEAAYPYVEVAKGRGPKGSAWHKLGYPYAPRLLGADANARARPVPVAVGQAMIFGLSLVHGGGISGGTSTRFSTDIRLVNSLAAVPHSRGVDDAYFVPLCSSAIGRTAERYAAANAIVSTPSRATR